MKIIERTNKSVSPNAWVLSIVKNMRVYLDGKTITMEIKSASEHDLYVTMAKAMLAGPIGDLDPAQMSNVQVEIIDDPKRPKDLIINIDWSNYEGEGGGFGGLLGVLGLIRSSPNLGDITFHNWSTTGIEIEWQKDQLAIKFNFENKEEDQLTYDVCGTGIHIQDCAINAWLIPSVFWAARLDYRRDKKGNKGPGVLCLGGTNIYRTSCDISMGIEWSQISPGKAAEGAKEGVDGLSQAIRDNVSNSFLFQILEALFILKDDLSPLFGVQSRLRGLDIAPNKARFLYFDEEDDANAFYGHGRIVAVRKERIQSHLLPPSEIIPGKKELMKYVPDNIIEVEVLTDQGKHIRISTLNLADSILAGTAKIEHVHVVLRDEVWGTVYSSFAAGSPPPTTVLHYSPYLRSNPDAGPENNLDNLPAYDYDRSDPLFNNLYDGTFYFVQADLLPNLLAKISAEEKKVGPSILFRQICSLTDSIVTCITVHGRKECFLTAILTIQDKNIFLHYKTPVGVARGLISFYRRSFTARNPKLPIDVFLLKDCTPPLYTTLYTVESLTSVEVHQ